MVRDEIVFHLENLGSRKEEIKSRLDKVLQSLDIVHLQNRVVTELSSGEIQKVALAKALIINPKILILDEPFARIDSSSALNLIEILKNLKRNLIIIIFEHHLDDLLEIADRLIILENGEIVSDASPENSFHLLTDTLQPDIMKIKIPGKSKVNYKFNSVKKEVVKFLLEK